MLISVIVTTYNRPDALRATLAGLAAQTDRDFEVRIADDGSRDATRQTIAEIALTYPVPLTHVWQVDDGFRAGAARNNAALAAQGEYLLFLDGDCVPRPDWIAQHRRLARRGWMVAGNRILLSAEFTQKTLSEQTPIHAWSRQQWSQARANGAINRTAPLTSLPLGPLRRLQARKWQRVRTCNLGVWRDDFVRVNGFDETFAGWGFEDSDLAVRLLNAGVRRLEGAYATGVLHLWHPESDRAHTGKNWDRLTERLKGRETQPEIGLDRADRAAAAQPERDRSAVPAARAENEAAL